MGTDQGEPSVVRVMRWPRELCVPGATGREEKIRRLVPNAGARIAMDMSGVGEDDLSTTLLGHLVHMWKRAREAGGGVKIFGAPPHLTRALEITRLIEAIPNHASEAEARAAFEA